MPILTTGAAGTFKRILAARVHNSIIPVRKKTGDTTVNANPNYAPSKTPVFQEFLDFHCSYYEMLSGKMNRLFGERSVAELTAQYGVLDMTMYAVQYVVGNMLIVPESPVATATILADLVVEEEVFIKGKWWKVVLVVPDSEGVQCTALVIV